MPSRSWRFHAGRIVVIALLIGLAGWAAGIPFWSLGIAAAVFVAWQAVNLLRFHRWVRDPASEIPRSRGLWADLYDDVSAATAGKQRQNEKDGAKIGEFISLTNALPDATLAIDENNVITWFNSAAEQLLELRNPEDLGRPISNRVRGLGFTDWLEEPGGLGSPLEIPSPRGDRRWLTINAVTFGERQRLIILRDTTEFHDLEKIRRDFVANISHELRTPLTVVQGYLELLEEHPSGEVSVAVGKMLLQTGHMRSLLDDLLELSRLQSGELQGEEEAVDIGAALLRLKEQAAELSRGRHDITYHIDHALLLTGVSADLESAFGNLISNAVRYTPEKGRIEVTWQVSDGRPQLIVSDEGIGIPSRDIPRVTERFYRVGSDRRRKSGGTGLGLAIVKHVLNAHQAELFIESVLGQGSTFTVTFPPNRARQKSAGAH